jgi:nicotinamidase/pyrazinamidase
MSLNPDTAVLVVDIQADFTELRNGSLAVPGTDIEYIDLVLSRTQEYKDQGLPIVATRDYHPEDHISFFTSHPGTQPFQLVTVEGRDQVLWPPHCVQGTPGVEILLPRELITRIISKGDATSQESYSGFKDDAGRETGLKQLLNELGVKHIIVYGIATDYCVRHTALHALEADFEVTVILGLSRGVSPDTTQAAVEEIKARGATVVED